MQKIKKVIIYKFILIVLLPILSIGFFFLIFFIKDLHNEITRKYKLYTEIIISSIGNQLTLITEDARIHKVLLEKYYHDNALTSSIFSALLETNHSILYLQITGNDGKNHLFFPKGHEDSYRLIPEPVTGQKQNPNTEFTWSESIYIPSLGTYMLALTVPFTDGILTQYYDITKIVQSTVNIDIGKNNLLVILDKSGNNLVQSSTIPQNMLADIISAGKAAGKKIGISYGKNIYINRAPYLVRTGLIRETAWTVAVLLSGDEIHPVIVKYMLSLVGLFLLVFCIALFYSVRQWKPILLAIRNLVAYTRKVTTGDYDFTLKQSSFQEIAELRNQFLHMVQAIRDREKALEESNEKIQKIFESSPYGFIVTDLDGIITDCNSSGAYIHGFNSREELIGLNVFQLIAFEDLEKAKDNLVKIMNDSAVHNVEYTLLKKNGTKFFCKMFSKVILNAENNPIAFINITTDISEQKRIETERENFITSLEQKQAELERFIYAVSHDLRSPLITIKGFLGFLEEDIGNNNKEQLKQDIKKISNAVDKMNNLLNDLLELSRIGRVLNEKEPVKVNTIINEVKEILTGQLNERGVRLEIQEDLPVISGNYERLIELFQNLVENSIKYMGNQENPRIIIGCKKNKFETIFFVRDNGIGIDPKYHEKIFGLFDQLNRNSPGTGIGLAIVKRIVETHNGKIWVESEGMGKGTTFFFTLAQAEEKKEWVPG